MSDIFIIPQKKDHIVYAPLLGIIFAATDVFCEQLSAYLQTGISSDAFRQELENIGLLDVFDASVPDLEQKVNDALSPCSMMFLFSESCNLKCKYCFASSGIKQAPAFNLELAKDAVAFIIRNAIANDTECTISFHGGGEPTYHIELLKKIIGFGNDFAANNNMLGNVNFMIVTNGFMSDEAAIWLSENMTRVQVSLDGYPEIQNEQRPTANGSPSFDRVFQTVKILEKGQAELVVRTTVSRKVQTALPAIAKFLCENVDAGSYYLGTVSNYGRAANSEYCEPEADAFVFSLLEAQKVANQYGKRIIACSAQDNFPDVSYEYCGATVPIFGLTKEGNITACPEVISKDDKRSELFWYGSYDAHSKTFVFDREKIAHLVSYRAKDTIKCCDCFAKYQCAGDCRARWYKFDTGAQIVGEDFRCAVNRALVEKQLQERVVG